MHIMSDTFISSLHFQAQKLTTAVYLLTGLFSNDEPLKWHLRTRALYLVSDIVDFETLKNKKQKSEIAEKILRQIGEIVSLIETGHIAGIISQMNRGIIVREYEVLAGSIKSFAHQNEKHLEGIMSEFFSFDPATGSLQASATPPIHAMSQKTVQEKPKVQDPVKPAVTPVQFKREDQNDENGSQRQEKILSIIKDKGRVTLSDISRVVTGVSEKTLQRDLMLLVMSGRLRKQGERRWTIYFLNQ